MRARYLLLLIPVLLMTAAAGCCPHCYFANRRKRRPQPPRLGSTFDVVARRDGLHGFVITYDKRLYCGGPVCSSEAVATFERLGVKKVINLVPGRKAQRCLAGSQVQLVDIPLRRNQKVSEQLRTRLLSEIRSARGGIYVCDRTGRDQAAAVGVLYRMEFSRWQFDAAFAEFTRLGGDPDKNSATLDSLKEL